MNIRILTPTNDDIDKIINNMNIKQHRQGYQKEKGSCLTKQIIPFFK